MKSHVLWLSLLIVQFVMFAGCLPQDNQAFLIDSTIPSSPSYEIFRLFGPEKLIRENKKPVELEFDVSASDLSGEFFIRVSNGGDISFLDECNDKILTGEDCRVLLPEDVEEVSDLKKNRVSSASINLNSGSIAIPEDFDKHLLGFTKKIDLLSTNTLKVKINGKPGSFIVIDILQKKVNVPPIAVISADPTSGSAPLTVNFSGSDSSDPEGNIVSFEWDFGDGSFGTGETISHLFNNDGNFEVTLTVTDEKGLSSSTSISIVVTSIVLPPIPPDPRDVAPPLANSSLTTSIDFFSFLIDPENPIQTGTSITEFDPVRVAGITGIVETRSGLPLAGVSVFIQDHPELGQTVTRSDGAFDLMVNGGPEYLLKFVRPGYFTAYKRIQTQMRNFNRLENVVMIEPDPIATTIDFTQNSEYQVHVGSSVTDEAGTRRPSVIFPPNVNAFLKIGAQQVPQSKLNVRTTEYSVGEDGYKAEPYPVRGKSYSFSFEISADEAIAANADHVEFDSDVIFYVDNFLDFPVGTKNGLSSVNVNNGELDNFDNSVIIEILNINQGIAEIDVIGNGIAATQAELDELGITPEELGLIDDIYLVGSKLLRSSISHFSYLVCPCAVTTPSYDLIHINDGPPNPGGHNDDETDNEDEECGSVVSVQSGVLKEFVPISGTGVSLAYSSNRSPAFKKAFTIDAPLFSNEEERDLIISRDNDTKVTLVAGGKEISGDFFLDFELTWDGIDNFGRQSLTDVPAILRYRRQNDGEFLSGFLRALKICGGTFTSRCYITGSGSADGEVSLDFESGNTRRIDPTTLETDISIGTLDSRILGLGGWSLSHHHFFNTLTRRLYMGDGRIIKKESDQDLNIIPRVGLGGIRANPSQGEMDLLDVELQETFDFDFDKNGNMYILEGRTNLAAELIIVVEPNGKAYGIVPPGGSLSQIHEMVVSDDGELYILQQNLLRKITLLKDQDSYIIASDTKIAGGSNTGENIDAINANISLARKFDVSKDGLILIGPLIPPGKSRGTVRMITHEGKLVTVAGSGETGGIPEDGTLALDAAFSAIESIKFVGNDKFVVADRLRERLYVVTNGKVFTLAGGGSLSESDLPQPARETVIQFPIDIATDDNENIYIIENSGASIRRIDRGSQIISRYAGIPNQASGSSLDISSGPSTTTAMNGRELAVSPSGSLHFLSLLHDIVYEVSSPYPNFTNEDILVGSPDADEIYLFDKSGKHLKTFNSKTNNVIREFFYDENGLLISSVDIDGNEIRVERDTSGNPSAIISPEGLRTELELNAQGYLSSIKDPESHSHTLSYYPNGLLESFVSPEGRQSDFTYDSKGQLKRDSNAASGFIDLVRTNDFTQLDPFSTVLITTAEGRQKEYTSTRITGGTEITKIDSRGLIRKRFENKKAGETTITNPDGSVVIQQLGADPRFGLQSPFLKFESIETLSGNFRSEYEGTKVIEFLPGQGNLGVARITETYSENGKVTLSETDLVDDIRLTTSPQGRTIQTHFDAKERPLEIASGNLLPYNFTYNQKGELTNLQNGNRLTTFTYDTNGFLTTSKNSLNETTEYINDDNGRVLTQILPDLREIHFSYDGDGNVTSVTPPGKPTHFLSYSPVNLLESYTPPDLPNIPETTMYIYNKDKQLLNILRPNNESANFIYDPVTAQLLEVVTDQGSTLMSYDPNFGQLVGMSSPDGVTQSFVYDSFLLLSSQQSGPVAGTVAFDYNSDFDVSGEIVNGQRVNFSYDLDRLLTGAGNLSLVRDPVNGLIIDANIGIVSQTFTYNNFGELEATTVKSNAVQSYSSQITRDDLGRITTLNETIESDFISQEYFYDASGRLEKVIRNGVETTYDYDDNSNRLLKSSILLNEAGTYDLQDRLTSYNGITYSYDANGDLTSKTIGTDTTTYDYDTFGNLKRVVLPNSDVIEYLIDGQNRRIGKKVNGILVQGFLYIDQLNPIAEVDASGNIVSRFVYGTKSNVPDYMIKNGTEYRIVSDHIGSPRLVVDVGTGVVVQRMDYDEFGRVLNDTNPGFQPFGFAGGIYDEDTGLTRFGARDYDAEIGRWTTRDPIKFDGGDTNLYGYVLSDPINEFDLTGLAAATQSKGGGAGEKNKMNCEESSGDNNNRSPSSEKNGQRKDNKGKETYQERTRRNLENLRKAAKESIDNIGKKIKKIPDSLKDFYRDIIDDVSEDIENFDN